MRLRTDDLFDFQLPDCKQGMMLHVRPLCTGATCHQSYFKRKVGVTVDAGHHITISCLLL
jgi:hypothetical protein